MTCRAVGPRQRSSIARAPLALLAPLAVAACDAGVGVADDPSTPVARVVVSPALDTLPPGRSERLEARAMDAAGRTLQGAAVHWSTSAPDVATVDERGEVRAVAPGQAVIGAVARRVRGEARVVVLRRPTSLEVSPATVAAGGSVTLQSTLRDSAGMVIPYTLTITSRDSAVLRVDSAIYNVRNFATGRAAGTATVAVTVEGRVLTTTVRVTPPRIAFVGFAIDDWVVPVGTSRQLDVGVFAEGAGLDFAAPYGGRVEAPTEWRSSNPAAVSVDARGVVTGVSAGDAFITATAGGVSGVTHVRAEPFPERLTFTAIAVGDRQSCALSAGGIVYCWGAAADGTIGVAGPLERKSGGFGWTPMTSAPLPVPSVVRFAALASGNATWGGCALTAAGDAYCWSTMRGAQPVPGGGGSRRSRAARATRAA